MKEDYPSWIKEQDEILADLRLEWKAAKEESKDKWMNRINRALDQRLRIMKLRDS